MLMMDDDLIIQALNDKVLDPLSRTNPYLEEDSESQADRTMLKSYELDYASDDEMKSRIAARLQSKTEESTKIAISGLTSSHLSINAITKLGRIHSLHVLIPTFQPSTVVSSLVYKIEINIPNTLKGNPFRMETLSKYKNHRFQLSQESKDEKIDVDLEGACPMHFDEDLIHHWMTQSIQFKITATYPSLKKDNRSHSEPEWKGTGKIDCKTLLGSFKFEGRIPIWNTSDKITQRLVGSLEVRLELVAESADIPMRTEVQIPSKQHAPVEEDSTVPKNTVLELPKLSNLYLYMHASTLRSQALSHISGSETVFVYLTVRLSPFSQPLETPPVILNPTFDSNTGKIMPPTDLKFHFTLPLVIQKGSDPSSYAPFIIEVWSLIGGSTSVSSSTSKQTHEGGPALLGLVKVPFQYLLSMALSEDKFLPVVLPDTEYVTMNPFTGFSVGWLKATLALGNLSDVTLFRKQREILSNETQPVQTEKPESARNVVEPERGSGSFKDEDVSRLRKIEALLEAQVAQALSPKRKEAKKRVAEDFRELDSQVVLSVGILKACGLQPLLLQAKNSLLSGSSLEDASELGANARVRLTVFPMGEDGTEDESVVETPISTNSFCPTFNHHVELTLAGLDTELIAWIRNGGSARGEIWHHVSSDLKATYSTEDVLLGEFEVPLGSLLTSRKGVNQEWFQVFSTNSGEAMGAIQISLAFGEGCNLGALSLFSSGIYSFNVDLSVKKVEIMKERDTAPDISSVIVRGSIPSRARSSEDIDYESFSSHPCRWTVTEDSQVAKISYSRLLTFCLDHTMKDVFESTTLALEFDVINETGLAKRLGGVSIDILGLLSQSRPSHKRMSEFLLKTSKNYIIVDEASADLCGARVQIELCVSRCKSISNGPQRVIDSRQRSEIKSQPGPRSASIPLRFFTTEETSPKIDLRIRIERAMHIPLTRDSFIDASPLAQSKGDQLAPLSALVTFDWIFDSVFQPSFSTRAIPFQKCPSWNEDFAVHLAKSPSSLDKLRQQSKITFKVWNAKSGLSQAVSEKGLDTSKELLGEVTVDLSSLFLGLDQISGWFPIRDNRDNNRGQLMVQIFSSESLKSAFKSLVHREPLMLRDKHHVFTHSTQFPFTADTKLSEKVCRNRASLYISNQPLSQSHNVDTWVWSGSKWEHRSVNKALTSKSETSGALGQSVFQKTVNELDHLQSKLRSLSLNPQQLSMPLPKTADNMITSLLPLPREGRNHRYCVLFACTHIEFPDDPISELERMDKILRISRSWSPEPARDETALEPLTFEELVSVPELKSVGTKSGFCSILINLNKQIG